MNVLAIYVANDMLRAEREKAYNRQYVMSFASGPSLRDRIASAADALRRLAGSSVQSPNVLPKLEDYPYRG